MEIQGLLQHLQDGKTEDLEKRHVVIPLLGEFKGELGERWHLLLLADTTKSRFKPSIWTERVALLLRQEGKQEGAVMCEEDGSLLSSSKVEDEFHWQLAQVQALHPHLISPSVDVSEINGLSRSMQRGSHSRATDEGVDKETRNMQKRWQTIESKQGSRARAVMHEHYLEVKLLAKNYLAYSIAL
eukprot:10757190-Ditylum_brightwellii.AAC.1